MKLALFTLILPLAPSVGRAQQWVQTAKIVTFNSGSTSYGEALASDGDYLMVSAPNHEGGYGSFYLFEPDPANATSWVAQAQFSENVPGSWWPVAVDISGNTVVTAFSSPSYGDGNVFVFEADQGGSGAWGQTAALPPSPAGTVSLGKSVAIDGDRIATGNAYSDVFIFERDQGGPGQWGEVARITVPHVGNEFGHDVALSGDLLVVGAPDVVSTTGSANKKGVVFVYRREASTGNWLFETRLAPPAGDFGYAVAASGDVIAVGAPGINPAVRGSVRLFRRQGGEWLEEDLLLGEDNWDFGYSVDLEGTRLVVGCEGASSPDQAFVFEYLAGSGWDDGYKLLPVEPSNSIFGYAVALSGDRIFVSDVSPPYNGKVYVFEPSSLP